MSQPEFDHYSSSYDDLLKDPIRDRFTGGSSAFFHVRKRDLIRFHFSRLGVDTRKLSYLDVGCGRGELVSLLRDDFRYVAGCDLSPGMLKFAEGIDARLQEDPSKLPFADEAFDFVTAVCVYHHVPTDDRLALTKEISRVLKPGGTFAIVEHNPHNPVTRGIVRRTPVDADAILLKSREASTWMQLAGFEPQPAQYFLYFPERLYRLAGRHFEELLSKVPLGGQYAVFSTRKKTYS